MKLKARLRSKGTARQDRNGSCRRARRQSWLWVKPQSGREYTSFDANCTFLQRQYTYGVGAHTTGVAQRTVFLKPPNEFAGKGHLLRLKKVVSGYAGTPRRRFNTSDQVLRQLGF